MLDSSLGKILNNKPVEPSISSNDTLSAEKEEAVTSDTKSEAEVRLVVRFFVEEHIVFNGRIEKVKQLESEELSRIVSRIAWDSSKSCQQALISDAYLLSSGDAANKKIDPASSQAISDASSSGDTQNLGQMRKPEEQNDEAASCTVSNLNRSSLDNDLIARNGYDDETLVAQKESRCDTILDHLKSEQLCDISSPGFRTPQPGNDESPELGPSDSVSYSSDVGIDQLSPNPIGELRDQENNKAETDGSEDQVNESLNVLERQTIADTLNDCVNSVEIEIQNSDLKNEVPADIKLQHSVASPQKSSSYDFPSPPQCQHPRVVLESHNMNNLRLQDKIEPEVLPVEASKTDKTGHELHNFAQDNRNVDIELSNQMIHHPDVKVELSPDIAKAAIISPHRRRNTVDNGPSNKRLRRSSNKDGRKSATPGDETEKRNAKREGDKRVSVRSQKRPLSRSIETPPNLSIINETDHFFRSSKIFAKWTDNHFYPGTILRPSKDRKYTVGYFDGAQRNVSVTDLIPLCNILGKQVRVSLSGDYCVNAIVHDKKSSPVDSTPLFDVEYQQDGLVSRNCVPLKDIFLTAEQGATLINQPIKPEKNPDESLFAGVDLDNIVHVKRSRRHQEMEESEPLDDSCVNQLNAGSRRKRNQYNTRNTNSKLKVGATIPEKATVGPKTGRRSLIEISPDTPASSCSPDNIIKTTVNCPNSNPPSESSSSTSIGSSNAPNVLEMGQEFYFDSSSPHRTKTSLLL